MDSRLRVLLSVLAVGLCWVLGALLLIITQPSPASVVFLIVAAVMVVFALWQLWRLDARRARFR
jgi:hypothetical protein